LSPSWSINSSPPRDAPSVTLSLGRLLSYSTSFCFQYPSFQPPSYNPSLQLVLSFWYFNLLFFSPSPPFPDAHVAYALMYPDFSQLHCAVFCSTPLAAMDLFMESLPSCFYSFTTLPSFAPHTIIYSSRPLRASPRFTVPRLPFAVTLFSFSSFFYPLSLCFL